MNNVINTRRRLLCCIALCNVVTANTQESHWMSRRAEYMISVIGGATIPNSKQYSYIAASDFGAAIAADWQVDGTEYWEQFWKQPRFGLHLEYLHSNYGIAGDRISLAAEMQNVVWRSTASGNTQSKQNHYNHELFWYTGVGLAIFTNPHERSHDTLNQFIGSYLNCIFNLGAGYTIGFHDHSALTFSLRFTHSSNGYMLKPNQGLNYLVATAGYRFSNRRMFTTQTYGKASQSDSLLAVRNSEFWRGGSRFSSHRIWLSFAPAAVQTRWLGTRNVKPKQNYYFAYTAQAGYMFYPNQCLGFGANIDVMYNSSHTEIVETLYRKKNVMPYLATALSFEPRWGCMSIRLSAGYYIVKSEAVDIPFYERLGVFFHFGNRLNQFAGVSIKAHAAHADYIEWHYGIELFVRNKKKSEAE